MWRESSPRRKPSFRKELRLRDALLVELLLRKTRWLPAAVVTETASFYILMARVFPRPSSSSHYSGVSRNLLPVNVISSIRPDPSLTFRCASTLPAIPQNTTYPAFTTFANISSLAHTSSHFAHLQMFVLVYYRLIFGSRTRAISAHPRGESCGTQS